MKYFILILTFLFVTLAFAKRDVDFNKFSEAMTENIDTVIKHNPQMYEKEKSRAPASVEIKEKTFEDTSEKIDNFDQQNQGFSDW